MAQTAQETAQEASAASQRTKLDVTVMIAIMALTLSAVSFYRSYIYTKQQLDVTVTEVSYNTNQGGLYMTVAFSNGGNRDAALLRIEPALWGRRDTPNLRWVPIGGRVHSDIPPTDPKVPTIIKAGGVEVVSLAAKLEAADVEEPVALSQGSAFLGIRVATMNSDGNLYLVEHPVARLTLDKEGHILRAEAAIHKSLSGFNNLAGAPPGDTLQANEKTPFVWADKQY
jgi:hypothetical protein